MLLCLIYVNLWRQQSSANATCDWRQELRTITADSESTLSQTGDILVLLKIALPGFTKYKQFHRNTAQSNRVAEGANRLYGRDEASRTRSELLLLECRYESCASERLNCIRRSGTRSDTRTACYPNVVSQRATR